MAWVTFDPGFTRHPKRLRAGPVASWLWAASVDYCVEHMTDGFLPAEAASSLVPSLSRHSLARETAILLQVLAWELTTDGYKVHDFLEYQKPASEVRRERASGRERARKWRASQRTNAERTPLLTPNVRQPPDPDPEQSSKKQKKGRTVVLLDDRLIQELSEDPAYKGMDVRHELAKMDRWLKTPRGRGKRRTYQRFVNWLNRADGNGTAADPDPYADFKHYAICDRCGESHDVKGDCP